MPWSGGAPTEFLVDGAHTPAWSADGRLVFFDNTKQDALYLAEPDGRNAKELVIDWPAVFESTEQQNHNHNMVWSPDNKSIYLVHGVVRDTNDQTEEMDIWRIRPARGAPERLTYLNTPVTFLAMLDQDTLVFIAPGEDGFGSWLWSLDVGKRGAKPQRIPTGLEQYKSVSASRDRGPLVATKANPTASLWSVPIRTDRKAVEGDVCRSGWRPTRAGPGMRVVRRCRCCFICRPAGPATKRTAFRRRPSKSPRARKDTCPNRQHLP